MDLPTRVVALTEMSDDRTFLIRQAVTRDRSTACEACHAVTICFMPYAADRYTVSMVVWRSSLSVVTPLMHASSTWPIADSEFCDNMPEREETDRLGSVKRPDHSCPKSLSKAILSCLIVTRSTGSSKSFQSRILRSRKRREDVCTTGKLLGPSRGHPLDFSSPPPFPSKPELSKTRKRGGGGGRRRGNALSIALASRISGSEDLQDIIKAGLQRR